MPFIILESIIGWDLVVVAPQYTEITKYLVNSLQSQQQSVITKMFFVIMILTLTKMFLGWIYLISHNLNRGMIRCSDVTGWQD